MRHLRQHIPAAPVALAPTNNPHSIKSTLRDADINTNDYRLGAPSPTDELSSLELHALDLGIGPAIGFPDISNDPVPTASHNSHVNHDPDGIRAQIDTGAFVTCTDQRNMLHNYFEFNTLNPCPVRLLPATLNSDTIPKGYGYLHVPAKNSHGCLAVRAFYTPVLRTTVIDERDLIRAAGLHPQDIEGERIEKHYDSATFTYHASHKLKRSLDVIIHGVLRNGKSYTDVLIPPHSTTCITKNASTDPNFIKDCERATLFHVYAYQENEYAKLRDELQHLPLHLHSLPFHEYIQRNTPVNAIKRETERLLWHQRLGHPSDYYLYNAHRHIVGVPQFKHIEPILESCPTCIRAKQRKEPAGTHTTRTATVPYQGLSIDFSFAGTKSANNVRSKDFVGFNGETCWILVTDHFSRMKHGDTRISKASPLNWLEHFLKRYAPTCTGKYVFLDQGGELYANPAVRALFSRFDYDIRPTGADASNQNGPVERGHLTVANAIRAMLTGANMDVRFWPYAFHHWLRIDNSIPSRDQTQAPLKIAVNQTDNFSDFRTFGCRVWVRPPGRRTAKLCPNSKKGIFLGFLPHTTKNILWYDPETSRVKIAKHARFDEGMNDLPLDSIPPNVIHLQRAQQGGPIPTEQNEVSISEFNVGSSPFHNTISKTLHVTCTDPTFGFTVASDELNNRAYVAKIKNRSSASKLFSSPKATLNKLRGAYIIKINGVTVFTRAEALAALNRILESKSKSFDIEFAPERKLTTQHLQRAVQEHNLFAPNLIENIDYNHALSFEDVRSIASVRHQHLDFSDASLSTHMAAAVIGAIRSNDTTLAEQSLGQFTRRKLRKLDTWPLWQAGERKQLDQFHNLRMYGDPVDRPQGAIILRQHWQYHIKRDGTRRARNCCDGSPRAAPVLHRFATTYSSCVEQPVQRLFFAIAAQMNYKVFGGDANDAYAHSPAPAHPTYVAIDDAYADWHKHRFGTDVDRNKVLPVQHALQGHPESGRLWESHITHILRSLEFKFHSTTHDKSIYRGDYNGIPIFLLRQVDDFALAAPHEHIAQEIYDKIGKQLQLPTEDKVPFRYLGLLDDFNGVDVKQHSDCIILSCERYIERVLRTHDWETSTSPAKNEYKIQSPLPVDAIPSLYATTGPTEGTDGHQALIAKHGFSYRTLLGELLYAYVTCRPDIGYAVITLSKFATCPDHFHFSMLKKLAKYLRATKHWGIHYQRATSDTSLPQTPFAVPSTDPSLPEFPAYEPGIRLTCFLDAAHANELRKRRSTSGFAFTLAGGCIAYKCKTQTTCATSSTEAEFYSAVSAAKHARYLRSILGELGFPQDRPTPLYCDNQSAIKMINARIPTERSRHILIQYFAIQDWKDSGDIIMQFIPGILNPADDLTKPLGWVLHSRHSRRIMGHYTSLCMNSPTC